jgi:predicted nucleotide-binding protein
MEADYQAMLDVHDIIADIRGPIRAARYIMLELPFFVDGLTSDKIESILHCALHFGAYQSEEEAVPLNPEVFVCYAIGDPRLEAVRKFLKSQRLVMRILEDDPVRSRTIMARLPDYRNVCYAIAIVTPTDEGCRKGERPDDRARQNVLFEIGYFMGCLGMEKVCLIKSGNVEIPSDLSGVVINDFAEGWETRLLGEMKAAEILPECAEVKKILVEESRQLLDAPPAS